MRKAARYKPSHLIRRHKLEVEPMPRPINKPEPIDWSKANIPIKVLPKGKYKPTAFRK
jgi:hypothetical protein